MENEFSVTQFFENGSYEKIVEFVSVEKAMEVFRNYTTNVAAMMGYVERVILTDGGDCINLEWQVDKGITYPNDETGQKINDAWYPEL